MTARNRRVSALMTSALLMGGVIPGPVEPKRDGPKCTCGAVLRWQRDRGYCPKCGRIYRESDPR